MPFHENRNNAHPAPFPVELPHRCIQLCSPPEGAVVLDPYMGSGSTAVASVLAGLRFVGFETSNLYTSLAMTRIRHARTERRLWDDALLSLTYLKKRNEILR
jgi:site-specific DNA-methyltransferase (adenine-specific)